MSKVEETIELLKSLGIPKAQQNSRSALTLLALLDIKENDEWIESKQRTIIIHDIIQFVKTNYDILYAENSRETIRRQTLHQFEQAGIVIRNLDDPKRATNSPKTNYAVTNDALNVIKNYKSDKFSDSLKEFTKNHGKLIDEYQGRKTRHQLSVEINGKALNFSPGKHNKLQIAIIEQLKSRFFNNAKLLYVGDTANKMLFSDADLIRQLNFPINEHDKLPDVVYYDEKQGILFLIEAVTTHGPMSPKRFKELEIIFSKLEANRVYISAFPTFREFKKYISDIAWETEVWIEETPEHMIHFNGPKFLLNINNESK